MVWHFMTPTSKTLGVFKERRTNRYAQIGRCVARAFSWMGHKRRLLDERTHGLSMKAWIWFSPSTTSTSSPSPSRSPALFRKCIFRKCIFRNFCKFLAGSFSAVSKRNFARKYAFDSIFQALQDLHPFAPLQSQNFRKKSVWKNNTFREISAKNCKCRNICKILSNFKNFS